ncbi:hypothetical protein Dimus_014073 [Dionaea muscipula]
MGEGREGDWECISCKNRNYAFRTFCNRCKQPRLLVDTKFSPDSKWIPRIGDWICTGCTNNNYASREKCKKCGKPRDAAAMPSIAMPGVYPGPGGLQQSTNMGIGGNSAFRLPLLPSSSWPLGGAGRYGVAVAPSWAPGGGNASAFLYRNTINGLSSVTKGWRNGDWICNCGFHNYSSRTECKNCNAAPPALGMKRSASDDLVHDWDNKRLNAGSETNQFVAGIYASYPGGGSAMGPNGQMRMQLPQSVTAQALVGKGAKQWRDGDWMCTSCNNHNYASRSQCNRCKSERSTIDQAGVA